ncbi:MAG: hypothetical protein QQN41_08225 [Nitrosopumilus sp.]
MTTVKNRMENAMTTVTVDVNNKMIDIAVKKELKHLELQIKRLKTSNDKLKSQIRAQNLKIEKAQRIVIIASSIAGEFGDEWEQE